MYNSYCPTHRKSGIFSAVAVVPLQFFHNSTLFMSPPIQQENLGNLLQGSKNERIRPLAPPLSYKFKWYEPVFLRIDISAEFFSTKQSFKALEAIYLAPKIHL